MILKQYYLNCLAHASYLIGDQSSGTAAVVDPQRDIDAYLDDASKNGLTIRHVFLTHFHADFLAGHLELRNRTGARIHLGSKAQAEFAFTPMADGASLDLGHLGTRRQKQRAERPPKPRPIRGPHPYKCIAALITEQ